MAPPITPRKIFSGAVVRDAAAAHDLLGIGKGGGRGLVLVEGARGDTTRQISDAGSWLSPIAGLGSMSSGSTAPAPSGQAGGVIDRPLPVARAGEQEDVRLIIRPGVGGDLSAMVGHGGLLRAAKSAPYVFKRESRRRLCPRLRRFFRRRGDGSGFENGSLLSQEP